MYSYPITKIFNHLHDNHDYLIDEFHEDNWYKLFDHSTTKSNNGISGMNFYETDNKYIFRLDIPGFKKEDLKIELVENQLKISGNRKIEVEKGAKAHYKEKSEMNFSQNFKLPTKVNSSKYSAKYNDGVLEITLEKNDEVKTQIIAIN